MSSLAILLALLAPLQDPKKPDPAAEAAKRAAALDRIMAEPRIVLKRAAQVPQPPAPPGIVMRGAQAMKRITLELKEVETGGDLDDAPMAAGIGRPINISELALSKDNFDRWAFDDTHSEEGRREHLGRLLTVKIQAVGALEPEQARKLRLAGNGDIKRFLDRAGARRAEFEAVRQDYAAGRLALGGCESLLAEYQAGPFGADSVFEKTLRKIRGEEKAATSGKK